MYNKARFEPRYYRRTTNKRARHTHFYLFRLVQVLHTRTMIIFARNRSSPVSQLRCKQIDDQSTINRFLCFDFYSSCAYTIRESTKTGSIAVCQMSMRTIRRYPGIVTGHEIEICIGTYGARITWNWWTTRVTGESAAGCGDPQSPGRQTGRWKSVTRPGSSRRLLLLFKSKILLTSSISPWVLVRTIITVKNRPFFRERIHLSASKKRTAISRPTSYRCKRF